MPLHHADLRYPHERVLLPRTKLAYVHLRNLLSDAKRDRSARVFGYVGIWLPDELLLLYLQSGEVVNATRTDGGDFTVLPIASALERVPHDPEFGEVCFHEADDEQLACMFAAQVTPPEPWPAGMAPEDAATLLPYLEAMSWDGTVEVIAGGRVSYLVFRDGRATRAFLGHDGHHTTASVDERVHALLAEAGSRRPLVRRWPVPPPLPHQAPPALIQAYRELAASLAQRLVEIGRESAFEIAEHARRNLLERHPALEHFSLTDGRPRQDPAEEMAAVTASVAAWIAEVLWTTADHDTISPEALLRDLTRERRHMLQSAGFYGHLPFTIEW